MFLNPYVSYPSNLICTMQVYCIIGLTAYYPIFTPSSHALTHRSLAAPYAHLWNRTENKWAYTADPPDHARGGSRNSSKRGGGGQCPRISRSVYRNVQTDKQKNTSGEVASRNSLKGGSWSSKRQVRRSFQNERQKCHSEEGGGL